MPGNETEWNRSQSNLAFFRIWPESRSPHRWSKERGLWQRDCIEVGHFLSRVREKVVPKFMCCVSINVNGHLCFIPRSFRWFVVCSRLRPYVSTYYSKTTILFRAIMYSPECLLICKSRRETFRLEWRLEVVLPIWVLGVDICSIVLVLMPLLAQIMLLICLFFTKKQLEAAARVTQDAVNIRNELKEKEEELVKQKHEGLWRFFFCRYFGSVCLCH